MLEWKFETAGDANRRLMDLLAGWLQYAARRHDNPSYSGPSQEEYGRELEAIADLYLQVGSSELTGRALEAFVSEMLTERVMPLVLKGATALRPSPFESDTSKISWEEAPDVEALAKQHDEEQRASEARCTCDGTFKELPCVLHYFSHRPNEAWISRERLTHFASQAAASDDETPDNGRGPVPCTDNPSPRHAPKTGEQTFWWETGFLAGKEESATELRELRTRLRTETAEIRADVRVRAIDGPEQGTVLSNPVVVVRWDGDPPGNTVFEPVAKLRPAPPTGSEE